LPSYFGITEILRVGEDNESGRARDIVGLIKKQDKILKDYREIKEENVGN